MDASPGLSALGSLFVSPGQGRIIRAFGAEMNFHLCGDQTEGRYLLATTTAPVGHGPPPHYHSNEDEAFLVLEGRVSFFSAGEWREVAPGETIFTPRRTVHTYKNIGDAPARMLFFAAPAGFELFFAECEKEFQKPGGPDRARITEISAAYGIYYV